MFKKISCIIGGVALVLSMGSLSEAASSAVVNVTVAIAAGADIAVIAGGPIDFATQNVGAVVYSGAAIIVKNTGTGSNQTFSLNCTAPSGWTCVTTAPAADQFRLDASFDADGSAITWGTGNALTTSPVAASATQFAGGDTTGAAVPYNVQKSIWLRMTLPPTTTSPGNKMIPFIITATVV